MKTNDKNFDLLAKGIVIQGIEDYKKALKEKWALENKLLSVNKTLIECEQFFYSEWCKDLSDIDDPTYIRNNSFIKAKKDFNKNDVVTVSVEIKPKKETKKKTKVEE